MKAWLKRYWFVLALPLAAALAWVVPGWGAAGGPLRSEITTKLGVAVIFLGQGLLLPTAKVWRGLANWRLHVTIQASTYILFPVLGWLLFSSSRLNPELQLGLFFLCALPSTIASSVVLTTQAGGNSGGALFNAVLSNLAGVVLTPLLMVALVGGGGEMRPLGPVVRELGLLIVLPLVVGQGLRQWLATRVEARRAALGNLNHLIILFIVYVAFANSVAAGFWAEQSSWGVLYAAALVGVLLFLMTFFVRVLAMVLRLERGDRIAAFFCGTQKTLAAGVPLAQVIFGAHPALGMILLPIMLYHGLQLMLGGAQAARSASESLADTRY